MAYQNVTKQKDSVIFGHNHRFDMKIATKGARGKLYSFSAGCMTHPKYDEPWCKNTRHAWDRGILILKTRGTDLAGFEWMDYNSLRRL